MAEDVKTRIKVFQTVAESAGVEMSWEDAAEYEVTNVWVEVGVDGSKTVVIEVQGRRADGSYWVNGFNIRLSRTEYDKLTETDLDKLITSKIAENEAAIQSWRDRQKQADMETVQLRTLDNKVQKLVGKKYLKTMRA
ncbi:MAG: hypothetical protein QXN23_05945 [Candidatus Caldarchaeum sp.]